MTAGLSVLALLTGVLLAWYYPLGQVWAMAGFLTATVAAAGSSRAWLVFVPALLPVIGLAPWTGWITFEEFDLLVLAVAAGGYGRMAWCAKAMAAKRARAASPSVLWWAVMVLFAASVLTAMMRGFNDAGGFSFGWFQGYHEPMNSVRLAKSFFIALLLLPLWWHAQRQQPAEAEDALALGLMLGLAAASLATVWERLAFTGLLNFSTDYRTTGPFWEMHVGGAALDGFLALTTPFAVKELLQARTPVRWGVAAAVTGLAGYACLTTFSRGVYLAVPVGLVVFYALHAVQQRHLAATSVATTAAPASAGYRSDGLTGALLVVGFGVFAAWMFQTSGYRGAGALLGAVSLVLPLVGLLRQFSLSQWMAGGMGGLLLAALVGAITWLVPKGAYIAFMLGFVFTALMYLAYSQKAITTSVAGTLALSGLAATLAAVVMVAGDWGYAPAVWPAVAATLACLLLLVTAGTARRPLWPDAKRWQAGVVCLMGLAVGIVAVFGGGAYMGDRFSTGGRDLDGRISHWKLGADMLQTPADWWLGKGEGRFVANHFLMGDPKQHPGDYRLMHEDDNNFLRLTGGLHTMGWGELLRVTQRVAEPVTPLKVRAQVRTAMDVGIHFEVCEKHLLYNQGCLTGVVAVKAAPGQWQNIELALKGDGVSRGAFYAPRLLAFSMAMDTRGGMADLDQLQLSGPSGRNLLTNGDFSDDMAHWFFSSDRHHLPWHIKSMFMHVLFDQGIVGLALWSLLVGGALVRLSVGKAKRHPLAPAFAASLVGFVVVGLFDSLLDVPRVAAMFYFITLAALALTVKPRKALLPP
jgi:hypothetical protein